MTTLIFIEDDTARCAGDMPYDLGRCERRRASHILPSHPLKRVAFRVLRAVFGERGRVSEWTRQWYGPWQLRMADKPGEVTFEAMSRRVVLAYERELVNERLQH